MRSLSSQPQYHSSAQVGERVPIMPTTSRVQWERPEHVTGGHGLDALASAAGMQQAALRNQGPMGEMVQQQQQPERVLASLPTHPPADPFASNNA